MLCILRTVSAEETFEESGMRQRSVTLRIWTPSSLSTLKQEQSFMMFTICIYHSKIQTDCTDVVSFKVALQSTFSFRSRRPSGMWDLL